MLYSLFLYGIIDWILEKIPVRSGDSQMGKRAYTNGGCSKRTSVHDGGEGQTFTVLVRTY